MTHESGARARREGGAWAVEQPAPHAQAAPVWEPEEHFTDAPYRCSAVEGGSRMGTHRASARPCLGARCRSRARPGRGAEGDGCEQERARGSPAGLHRPLPSRPACVCAGRAVARTGCCAQPCLGTSRRASGDEEQAAAVGEGVCEGEGRPQLAWARQPRRGEAEEQVRDVIPLTASRTFMQRFGETSPGRHAWSAARCYERSVPARTEIWARPCLGAS